MRKSPLGLIMMGLPIFFVGCGGGNTNTGSCTTSANCQSGFLCHPFSGVCVPDCNRDGTVCSGTQTPLCRTQNGDVLENMCICDTNSCPTGQGCNRGTGLCEAGNQQLGCTTGMTGGNCAANEICVGGDSCQAFCDDLMSCIGS